MRPLQWLKLISKNRGTVSVAPPFGYELCQRRVNEKDLAELDLSCWRVAGIGAEPISAEQLHQFAECFRQVNFDDKTFMPCYGLAENALAVSFSDEACGVVVNEVDRDILEYQGKAVAPGAETRAVSTFVNCGKALPEHGIEIRNEADIPVAERGRPYLHLRPQPDERVLWRPGFARRDCRDGLVRHRRPWLSAGRLSVCHRTH